jgi:hypothetical protein
MGPANRRWWLCGDPNAKFFFEKSAGDTKWKTARKTQPTGACLKSGLLSQKMGKQLNSAEPGM